MQLLATKALAAGFAVSMAVGGTTTTQMPNATASPATIYYQNSTAINFPSKSVAKKSALDLWLKKLAYLESEGRDNLKVLDLNGLHSFGCLQFQMDTFREFGLRYGLISEDDNLEKVIYDCALQKKIAKEMLRENYGYWRKWYTSVVVKGLGLPPVDKELITVSMK